MTTDEAAHNHTRHQDHINNNWVEPNPQQKHNCPTMTLDDLGAPPPYAPPYPTAPPYYPTTVPIASDDERRLMNRREQENEKEDLDFFKYTIPCKKIATYISVCVALIVIVVILLLLIFGQI